MLCFLEIRSAGLLRIRSFTKKESFEELTLDEKKQFLVEVLDKNQLYVNVSEIEDQEFGVNEEEKKLNRAFYDV